MQVISTSRIQNLDWNSNKKCFKILDSTDRKILSFLWNSVLSNCYFFPRESLSTFPWIDKGFTSFKPLFLKNIEFKFKLHIVNCPIQAYKQTINSIYKDLQKQIGDFEIEGTVSKENACISLEKIMTDCFRKLFDKAPLNMSSVPLCDLQEENKTYLKALNEGQCYHYAFYLAKEYKVLSSLIPLDSACNAAFILYPKYFIRQLGYSETETPTKGDLVLYLGNPKLHNNNCRFKHMGMMTEKGTVKSYWLGFPCQLEHQISQVPDAYGFDVIFFHKKTLQQSPDLNKIIERTNQMSILILKFNSQYIPTPLTIQGALLFLLDKLKSACAKSNPSSEQWNWKKIKENLFGELFLNLKEADVLKEFQLWLQETLPEYY